MKLETIVKKAGFSTDEWDSVNRDLEESNDKDYEVIRCEMNTMLIMEISRSSDKPKELYIDIIGHIEEQQAVLDGKPLMDEFMEQVDDIRSCFSKSRILNFTSSDSGIYGWTRTRGSKNS